MEEKFSYHLKINDKIKNKTFCSIFSKMINIQTPTAFSVHDKIQNTS